MIYEVVLQPEAISDLREGISYYTTISKLLGRKFQDQVKIAFSELTQLPFYQIRYDGVRTRKVKLFPYIIHFRVEEKNSIVRIYAIRFALRKSESNTIVKEDKAVYSLT